MNTSPQPVSALLNEIRRQIQIRRDNPPRPCVHLHKFHNIRLKFSSYSEETTPKPALSDMYTCVGRHKLYPDSMMFMYLEVSNSPGNKQSVWPAKATWKVELMDEDDPRRTFPLGESSFIFNKPKQGFVSHPNDWISVSLQQLESSQLISPDGSVTVKWSVTAAPAIEYVYLEQLEELVLQTELNSDMFDLSATERVGQISRLCLDNTAEISHLRECVNRMTRCLDIASHRVHHLKTNVKKNSQRISDLESSMMRMNASIHTS